ncbi:MAG: SDR family NAD(P)-dependent oxidoreductase [Mangrovibacterium sp.]
MNKSILGKTALITGASSGIGEAFACELARRGCRLILTARSADRLKALAGRLRSDYEGTEVWVVPADLTASGAPEQLAGRLGREGHRVDMLVNNAGFGKWAGFLDEEMEVYEQMMQLNLSALVKLTYLLLPAMLEKGEGGVINIASTAAFQPCPYFAVYGAGKAFVLSFSEALYEEYRRRGITVTAVCPGYTKTRFWEEAHMCTKGLSLTAPERVAREGLRAFLKGKNYRTTGGVFNYLMAQSSRLISRRLAVRVVGRMFRGRLLFRP